jgi:hypothetical protein
MRIRTWVLPALLGIWLSACAAPAHSATPVPPPTATLVPTATPMPTPSVVPTVATLLYGNKYTDTAIPVWNNIPIMSGAIRGTGDNTTYRFATNAAPDKIQAYYKYAMGSLGWTLTSTSDQVGTIVMIFNHGKDNITISVTSQAAFNLVVLTKGQ